MTNTEIAAPTATFTPEQKATYRADIVGFIEDLAESGVFRTYRVINAGKIIPGDAGGYTSIVVLRDLGHEFVVHTLIRVDDRAGGLEWSLWSGDYFRIVDYPSRADALAEAEKRMNERKF